MCLITPPAGLLLRHYTQNIDTLERGAGIPADKLVEAHGTFYTSHCIDCRKEYDIDFVKGKQLVCCVDTRRRTDFSDIGKELRN